MKRNPDLAQRAESALQTRLLSDAGVIRRELEESNPQANPAGPFLVALCGLPGVGKSYFAREVTKRGSFLVLESDRIRKALVAKPKYSRAEHRRVFSVCHFLIEEYLSQGQRVLFDATNLSENFRLPLREIALRQNTELLLIRLTAPRELVRQRLVERESGIHPNDYSDAGWAIYCRMAPYEEAVEGDHRLVDTSKDITPWVEEVIDLVTGLNGAGFNKTGLKQKTQRR